MDSQKAELLIFDIDGTLADRETGELLPGVLDFFEKHGDAFDIVFATNQGGVGLRYWMESEGFGEPEKFPTQQDVGIHINTVLTQLPERFHETVGIYVCYAYQSKNSGNWSPTPEQHRFEEDWDPNCRKPNAGMLVSAMRGRGLLPSQCLMVGDGDEDEEAAEAAGCHFRHADQFFGRS